MIKKLTFLWVFLIFFLISGISPNSQQNRQEDPLAVWVMERVVEKSLENERVKRQYITYDKYQIIEDLTKQPPKEDQTTEDPVKQPPKARKEFYNIYGENGHSMERLFEIIDENGKQKFVKEKGKQSKLDFNNMLANKYLPRMIFRKVREEVIDGKGYFVITFEPKAPPNQLPSDDLYDGGINRSSGTIYVDMEKFYPWKFESKLTSKFSAYLVGQAEEFQINVEQEERFGIVVPKRVIYTIKYKFLWMTTYERRTSTYGNHHDLRDPAAQDK